MMTFSLELMQGYQAQRAVSQNLINSLAVHSETLIALSL